jgi:predicted 3-demethylubiquinone-9 3-methyltransferase (glyoxalase superfamily)
MELQKITPWLWFDGQAEQAAEFYVSVFQQARIVNVSRFPEGEAGEPGTVMVVEFELFGQQFYGLNGGPNFKPNEAVSFMIRCEDQAEINHYWHSLTTDGGEESYCGWVKDKFGFSWQITPRRMDEIMGFDNPEKSARTMHAMMQMRKLDIATLERARDSE